jgi:hypothetical protein
MTSASVTTPSSPRAPERPVSRRGSDAEILSRRTWESRTRPCPRQVATPCTGVHASVHASQVVELRFTLTLTALRQSAFSARSWAATFVGCHTLLSVLLIRALEREGVRYGHPSTERVKAMSCDGMHKIARYQPARRSSSNARVCARALSSDRCVCHTRGPFQLDAWVAASLAPVGRGIEGCRGCR